MIKIFIGLCERGLVPDFLLRWGIRRLCAERLESLLAAQNQQPQMEMQYREMLKQSPVAVATKAANEQHYEVPAGFFQKSLGPYRKYSCAYWPEGCVDLEEAEKLALEISMDRAELRDGMNVLELGCGWGSLTLAMATKFPNSKITAISNSNSQRLFIENQARVKNLKNITVLTKDVSVLEDLGSEHIGFDRVVSIEMFEHFRNYEILLRRISRWLAPGAKVFIHIFTHRKFSYLFETEGDDNWMGRYFFTGGQMPSHSLLPSFQQDLTLEKEWTWEGTHYQKTSEAWLENINRHRPEILKLFTDVYGAKEASRWFYRWQIFFLAVAELFGYRDGHEWGVSHYLFSKKNEERTC